MTVRACLFACLLVAGLGAPAQAQDGADSAVDTVVALLAEAFANDPEKPQSPATIRKAAPCELETKPADDSTRHRFKLGDMLPVVLGTMYELRLSCTSGECIRETHRKFGEEGTYEERRGRVSLAVAEDRFLAARRALAQALLACGARPMAAAEVILLECKGTQRLTKDRSYVPEKDRKGTASKPWGPVLFEFTRNGSTYLSGEVGTGDASEGNIRELGAREIDFGSRRFHVGSWRRKIDRKTGRYRASYTGRVRAVQRGVVEIDGRCAPTKKRVDAATLKQN